MVKDKEFLELVLCEVGIATRGECVGCITNIRQDNGKVLTGIIIQQFDAEDSPVVYLEPFYQMYLDDMEMEKIARTILNVAEVGTFGSDSNERRNCT